MLRPWLRQDRLYSALKTVLPTASILTVLLGLGNLAWAAPEVADDLVELPKLTEPTVEPTLPVTEFSAKLEQLERENAQLAEQQATLVDQIESLSHEYDLLSTSLENRHAYSGSCQPRPICQYDHQQGQFVLVRGFKGHPFELRLDVFTEARNFNFDPDAATWTDSTGTPLSINEFDSTEINRNFIQFSGYALDPKLQFTAMIFSSTSLDDTLYLGWINYRFSEALDIRVGNWLVPGTREWYQSFRYTLGAERLMATTFFRPNVSPGIWAQGTLFKTVRYVAMFANSQNRFGQGVNRFGDSRAVSATVWWEPTGDFGLGPSDIEYHESPSFRIGTSMTYSKEANQGFGDPELNNPEDTILRLSDGTPLFRPGALAPGVQLESTRYNMWAIDAAGKYRGMSLSFEYFFRLLNDFVAGPGPLPIDSLFDHGGLFEGGVYLIPHKLELFARTSHVTGDYGSGSEYGGGVNWYPQGSREWRFTAEVLQIDSSPAENLLTGYRAGHSGTLFQLQWFSDF